MRASLAAGSWSWSWSWEKDWVWGQGSLLATIGATEGRQQVVVDHLGSVGLVANRCGQRLAELATNPWGLDLFSSTQNSERHRFTGHLQDTNALDRAWDDFDYMHARYYGPMIGRFMSIDPIRGTPKVPGSWNLYTYGRDNPLRFIDPLGLLWFDVGGKWTYFKDTDSIQVVTVDDKGKMTATTVKGYQQVVSFDGNMVTLGRKDGSVVSWKARAGEMDDNGNTQAQLQGVPDRGPIPEGRWSFNPKLIQNWADTNTAEKVAARFRRGGWKGGPDSWGYQRVWLNAETYTGPRDPASFSIHGGARFGSAGCIDLARNGAAFFGAVDTSLFYVPVLVDYP